MGDDNNNNNNHKIIARDPVQAVWGAMDTLLNFWGSFYFFTTIDNQSVTQRIFLVSFRCRLEESNEPLIDRKLVFGAHRKSII